MARGNRRESIFFDDDDRRFFLKTLSEACAMGLESSCVGAHEQPLPSFCGNTGTESCDRHAVSVVCAATKGRSRQTHTIGHAEHAQTKISTKASFWATEATLLWHAPCHPNASMHGPTSIQHCSRQPRRVRLFQPTEPPLRTG